MKCAIYCRLSREDEEKNGESESIQNQKSLLTAYALERQWEIFKIYCDEDFSGTDNTRPDFNSMINDAKKGRFDIVLCKSQSRFTRDIEVFEKYVHGRFPLWGIRFVTVTDCIDTDIKGNKKARQINSLINEWYLEDLSDSVKAVLDHKRKNGIYIGGFPLYGYKKNPDFKGKLIIDPDAAEVVRTIFSLYLEGNGKQHIANLLNKKGIPNPSSYKKLCGSGYVNGNSKNSLGLWNKNTINRILQNEMYIGTMVQGTRKKVSYKSKYLKNVQKENWIRVADTHPAIIDKETFFLVQKRLHSSIRTDNSGELHPFAGKIFCADCHSTMSKTTNIYKGEKRSYLRCRLSVSGNCSRHSIRLDSLEREVSALLAEHFNNLSSTNKLLPMLDDFGNEAKVKKLEKQSQKLIGQLNRKTKALSDLYTDKANGNISGIQYKTISDVLQSEIEKIQKQSDSILNQIESLNKLTPDKDYKNSFLNNLVCFSSLSSEAVGIFIDRIEIGEKQDNKQKIKIFWSF